MLTKVFQSGNSQAVRIPLDYRFNTDTVEIFRADNGDIILRPARLSGEAFLDLFSGFDDDFIAALADRDDDPPRNATAYDVSAGYQHHHLPDEKPPGKRSGTDSATAYGGMSCDELYYLRRITQRRTGKPKHGGSIGSH